MALTLKYLANLVEYVAKGTTDSRIEPKDLVNQAGEYLMSMSQWSFTERPEALLNFISGQQFVLLPPDLTEIVALEVYTAVQTTVSLVRMSDLIHLRASIVNNPLRYYAALEFPDQENTQTEPPPPRLTFWPTPTGDVENALRMAYRSGWRTLTKMDQVANVPGWVAPLLIEMVRAYSRGSIKPEGSVSGQMEAILKSELFYKVRVRDGMIQPQLGPTRGGVTQRDINETFRPHRYISAGGF